jgi:predicted metal-binding membrane protein
MGAMTMPPAPFSAAYLSATFVMWAIMMVAMMVPSAAPMILLHARIDRAPSLAARLMHTLLFAWGYLLVWTIFSVLAAAAQAGFVASGAMSAAVLRIGSRELAAVVLFAAAGYELTAAKRTCLDSCQSPLVFVARYWRPGGVGAFRLGFLHGLNCLGCCWVLMLLLFVGGVMNLAWVAGLGIAILGEKLTPPRWHANLYIAAALFLGGISALTR